MPIEFDPERAMRSPWAAGALGSVVALKFAPGMSWGERAFNVVCGALSAGFVAPPLCEYLHLTSAMAQSGAAFLVGLFGLSLAAALVEAVRVVGWGDVIRGWVSRRP